MQSLESLETTSREVLCAQEASRRSLILQTATTALTTPARFGTSGEAVTAWRLRDKVAAMVNRRQEHVALLTHAQTFTPQMFEEMPGNENVAATPSGERVVAAALFKIKQRFAIRNEEDTVGVQQQEQQPSPSSSMTRLPSSVSATTSTSSQQTRVHAAEVSQPDSQSNHDVVSSSPHVASESTPHKSTKAEDLTQQQRDQQVEEGAQEELPHPVVSVTSAGSFTTKILSDMMMPPRISKKEGDLGDGGPHDRNTTAGDNNGKHETQTRIAEALQQPAASKLVQPAVYTSSTELESTVKNPEDSKAFESSPKMLLTNKERLQKFVGSVGLQQQHQYQDPSPGEDDVRSPQATHNPLTTNSTPSRAIMPTYDQRANGGDRIEVSSSTVEKQQDMTTTTPVRNPASPPTTPPVLSPSAFMANAAARMATRQQVQNGGEKTENDAFGQPSASISSPPISSSSIAANPHSSSRVAAALSDAAGQFKRQNDAFEKNLIILGYEESSARQRIAAEARHQCSTIVDTANSILQELRTVRQRTTTTTLGSTAAPSNPLKAAASGGIVPATSPRMATPRGVPTIYSSPSLRRVGNNSPAKRAGSPAASPSLGLTGVPSNTHVAAVKAAMSQAPATAPVTTPRSAVKAQRSGYHPLL